VCRLKKILLSKKKRKKKEPFRRNEPKKKPPKKKKKTAKKNKKNGKAWSESSGSVRSDRRVYRGTRVLVHEVAILVGRA
jgi:hypothetical protein